MQRLLDRIELRIHWNYLHSHVDEHAGHGQHDDEPDKGHAPLRTFHAFTPLSDWSTDAVARMLLDALADPGEIDTPIDIHPDQERLAAEVLLRQEAPVSAVFTVVAIVAHHEIVARRDHPFTFTRIAVRQTGALEHEVRAAGELFAQFLGTGHADAAVMALVGAQRLVPDRLAIDVDLVVVIAESVAPQAHDALDPVLFGMVRRMEHHHVTAL